MCRQNDGMISRPPLTDSMITALARLVDDSQIERREPSHSDIEFHIKQAGLFAADPSNLGKPVGKSKRVRGTLSWALSNNLQAGEQLVCSLVALVQGYGGFRSTSSNFCGLEAITNLSSVFASQGWELDGDGGLRPKVLESLVGKAMTTALVSYVDRARRGSLDSPLVTGTAKDLLEAVAAHVLTEKWGSYNSGSNFPALLGQAFNALGFATDADPVVSGEPIHKRVERAAFVLGCTLNTLRNKEGTGHGRPWLSSVTPSQARFSVESMGNISSLMLDKLTA